MIQLRGMGKVMAVFVAVALMAVGGLARAQDAPPVSTPGVGLVYSMPITLGWEYQLGWNYVQAYRLGSADGTTSELKFRLLNQLTLIQNLRSLVMPITSQPVFSTENGKRVVTVEGDATISTGETVHVIAHTREEYAPGTVLNPVTKVYNTVGGYRDSWTATVKATGQVLMDSKRLFPVDGWGPMHSGLFMAPPKP